MSADPISGTPGEGDDELQGYLCARADRLSLPEKPDDLHRQLRSYLYRASDERLLSTRPQEVFGNLKLADTPVGKPLEYRGIYGGEKDLKRTGDKACFRRGDGAWFTFTLTVRAQSGRPLALIAYDFELCFPQKLVEEGRFPRFVRFDLNSPEHRNLARGLRCHRHPGHDDLIVPAPLMSPLEVLALFVSGLAVPDRARKA